MRGATIIPCAVALGLPAGPGMAQICFGPPAACEISDGVLAAYVEHRGRVVVFEEIGTGADRMIVTECNSRSSLAITRPSGDAIAGYFAAEDLIRRAVTDDMPQTLTDLADQITRETNTGTRIFILPQGHCGCDLPNIDPPPVTCPPG